MRDWTSPLGTRVPYTPAADAIAPDTPAPVPDEAPAPDEASDDAAGVERCEVCGAAALSWRNCKLVCRNCRSIVKSCADL